jgi:hypothetical protein
MLEQNRIEFQETQDKPSFAYPPTELYKKIESDSLSDIESKKLERAVELFKHNDESLDMYPKITDKTESKALERISIFRNSSEPFNILISQIENANPALEQKDLLRVMRENDELRTEIGLIIQDSISNLWTKNKLPERLMLNSEKNPRLKKTNEVFGLRSQEYSAQLALTMLDGSFDDEYHGDGPIDIGASGKVISGQHRAGGLMAIGDWKF